MNTTIIFILLAVAVVGSIVWAWSFRHRKTKSTTTDNVSWRSADANSSAAELSELPEVLLIGPDIPQSPLPTSPDTPILVVTQPNLDENLVVAPEVEEIQSAPFPSPIIRIEDGTEIAEASRSGLPATESRAVDVESDVTYALVNEPTAESAVTNEVLIEAGNPTETVTVDTLTHDYVAPDAHEIPQPSLPKTDPTPTPPTYHPPTPPVPKITSNLRKQTSRSTQNDLIDLRLRVQLVFGRGGIKTLALVADRREGMPTEIEVTGTQGKLHLVEQSDECYEPMLLSDAATSLRQGVEWRARGDTNRWRWVLGGRELYVLAPGDKFGLHGFISTARLQLNTRHMILSTAALREQVLAALTNAGCAVPDMYDDTMSHVPSGWILFREVTPTRLVPMREDGDILNTLCPTHDIEPYFSGGIRLERNTWLLGFPPRIRFTGETGDGFQVMIDSQPAQHASDGAFEASGWDVQGEHRLWFADRAETYSLSVMEERWNFWRAHDLGTRVAICGAGLYHMTDAPWHQVRVPTTNLLVIGARPGEIFNCTAQRDVRSETILALIPFRPVWALPIDPVHSDKRLTRIILLNFIEPTSTARDKSKGRNIESTLKEWAAAINGARRKQLRIADAGEDVQSLWRRYGNVAKRLWKRQS